MVKKVMDILKMKKFQGKKVFLYINEVIIDKGINLSLFKSLYGDLEVESYKINDEGTLIIYAKVFNYHIIFEYTDSYDNKLYNKEILFVASNITNALNEAKKHILKFYGSNFRIINILEL